jgi:hypothetical protein
MRTCEQIATSAHAKRVKADLEKLKYRVLKAFKYKLDQILNTPGTARSGPQVKQTNVKLTSSYKLAGKSES